jgi:hypothetical protein
VFALLGQQQMSGKTAATMGQSFVGNNNS